MRKIETGVSESDRLSLQELLPKEIKYGVSPETIDRLLDMGNTVILEKGDALIASGEKDSNL